MFFSFRGLLPVSGSSLWQFSSPFNILLVVIFVAILAVPLKVRPLRRAKKVLFELSIAAVLLGILGSFVRLNHFAHALGLVCNAMDNREFFWWAADASISAYFGFLAAFVAFVEKHILVYLARSKGRRVTDQDQLDRPDAV